MAGRGNPLVETETLAELEAQLEVIKSKIASIKANQQAEKAAIKSNEAAMDRNLTGIRDKDGNLVAKKGDIAGSSADLTTGEVTGEKGDAMAFAKAAGNISTDQMIEEDMDVIPATVQQVEEDDMITDKQISSPEDDIEGDERTDAESEKMRHGGIDPEEGRTKPVESDARSEKPGWEMAEGGNTWSINEKDDYWKTQEGFDEAMNLYGQKPSWLKEPTLVYNPETDEYEEIEEEEFEDLSRPAVSADIKKLFG